MKEEEYKCIICGEEKQTLIGVITKKDEYEIFLRHRGICQKCLNENDIEKYCKDFITRKLDEDIEKAKNHLQFLNDEKNKLIENEENEKGKL